MFFYSALLVADLVLWYLLLNELKGRNMYLRLAVLLLKAAVTVIFLTLLFRIVFYRGEFAEPANAFRQIQMGAMALLLLSAAGASLLVTLFAGIVRSFLRKRAKSRRQNILINTIIFVLVVAFVADGYFRQRLVIRFVRQEVKVPDLDPALDGLKIVLISDLHLSSWQGKYQLLDQAMEKVGKENPDLVLNTGDFITYGWQEFGSCDTILRKGAGQAGSFAVDGNHDDGSYYPSYDRDYGLLCREMVKQKVEASGYTLLRDSALTVSVHGTEIAVAGVETHGHHLDMHYGNFEKVLGPLPDSLFTILLIHDPESWLLSAVSGSIPQLTVAGHTHGFQAALPFALWAPASLVHERWKGIYEFRGSHLYVTSGIGTMGMAARFFMPPEIVIITLRTN
jgi:predicted MPP superfamily phosphohydrolase